VKVPSPFSSNALMRIVAAGSLAWVLAVGGAAAPLTANAESTVAPEAPASSATTSAPSAEASASASATPSVAATPAPDAAPVAVPKPKKLTIRQTIAKVGRSKGLSKAEIAALLWLAKRESNYHPKSHSRSECHGLFQLSAGMAHGKPWKDPVWNTKRAIKYMKGRYGGVLKAKAFWIKHHWY